MELKGPTDDYLGVYETLNGRWRARISYDHETHRGGTFDTKEEAAARYNLNSIPA